MFRECLLTATFLALVAATTTPCWANETPEKINTDRPHNAEAPYVLPEGWTQTETGALWLKARGEQSGVGTFPSLFRYGTGDGWELRVESDTFQFDNQRGGFNDVSVGFKRTLVEDDVEISILGRLFVPVGSPHLRAGGAEPDIKFTFGYEINEDLELEWNVGGGLPLDPTTGERYFQHFLAANLTQTLHENLGVYFELVNTGADLAHQPSTTHLDTGFIVWVNDDLQLDFEYYRGLSSGGIDWGLAMGLSTRW